MARDDKRSASLQKAMSRLNAVEVQYARLVVNMSNGARLKLYRKIASLMRNRFSLMDALDRLHDGICQRRKKRRRAKFLPAIVEWSKKLQNGIPFPTR